MEPKFQSSFIPKGPVATANPLAAQYTKPKTAIFGFLATVIFILTLAAAIGVFAYDRYLLSSIGTMGENLANARATLQPDTIQELVRVDRRILGTRQLLSRHTALSPFFDYLENATLRNMRFTEFKFTQTDKGLEVMMKGQARSYSDVALQSEAFNKSKIFADPVFSDLELDAKGNVTFTFRALLDQAAVSYKKRIDGVPVGVSTSTAARITAPVATSTQPVATSTATTTRQTTATSTATTTRTTR